MTNSRPFFNIDVSPTHGSRACRLSWDIDPAYVTADIYVYFSTTGVTGSWDLRTNAPLTNVQSFVDDKFVMTNKIDVGYYRLLAVLGQDKKPSAAIPIFGAITPKEYGIVNRIMQYEWRESRTSNGIPMYHCVPKDHGDPAANVDSMTGQYVGVNCDADHPSYGMPYAGGYWNPFLTWVRLRTINLSNIKDNPAGLGKEDDHVVQARLLAFPRPVRGHMFVNAVTDERYVVSEAPIKPYMLRGTTPIAYEVTMEQLARNDPRYKLPMPADDIMEFRQSKKYKTGMPL